MVVTKLSVTKLLLLRSYQNGCSCDQFLLHNKMSLLFSYKIVIIIVCRYQNGCYQNATKYLFVLLPCYVLLYITIYYTYVQCFNYVIHLDILRITLASQSVSQ